MAAWAADFRQGRGSVLALQDALRRSTFYVLRPTLALGGGVGLVGLLYWQVVIAEGAYLGPWAVRLVYGLGARHYDAVRQPWQADADATLAPLLWAGLAGLNRPRVLDIATGTGRVPLLLCAEPTFRGQVAALDLTPAMLEAARRKAAAWPGATIGWHRGEAGRLPWAADAFDLITCLEALEFFPRPRRALAEMARVLKPGGALLLSKVPDRWAYLLPGRALNRVALAAELRRHDCVDVAFQAWQHGHYELVHARKSRAQRTG
jgi:ubiquinone/menaquinone biosynthesis C-methylase UbiE